MKVKNYKESVAKWRKIVKALKTGLIRVSGIRGYCGFCKEINPEGVVDVSDCMKCPLYPKYCSEYRGEGTSIFWRLDNALYDEDQVLALKLAKEMLSKIKEFNPALENTAEKQKEVK